MRWGIRAQVLLTLSVVVAFGLFASYLVTSRVTRSTVLEARVEEARAAVALAAERFAGVPTEGHAFREILARVRPLVAPDFIFVLGGDMRPALESGEASNVFDGLVDPLDLGPLHQRSVQHAMLEAPDGQPLLVAMAPISAAPRRPGRAGVGGHDPVAVCVLAPLNRTFARVDRLDTLFLLFTATILVLALVLGYTLLGRSVVRPVMRLLRTAERVRSGDLSVSGAARSPASGELGELEAAVDRMTRQLHEDRKRIELQIRELEHANSEIATAQERLVLTEKLASVGQLAAGVAHEIGNPIAILQGYLEMLADPDLEDAQRAEYVRVMEEALDRVATIIRDLLDFARPADEADDACDAVAAIEHAAKLVRPQKRFQDIELTVDAPDTPVGVAIPQGRLEQVVLNLLLNAADASSERGSVTVVVHPNGSAAVGGGGMVHIEVRDQGRGIAPEDVSRIFDPFFTTKDPGEGTGLGLAVCHGIIKTWGGRIEVDSAVGEGARFTVVVPALRG